MCVPYVCVCVLYVCVCVYMRMSACVRDEEPVGPSLPSPRPPPLPVGGCLFPGQPRSVLKILKNTNNLSSFPNVL